MSRAAERITAKGELVFSHAFDRRDGRAGCDRVYQLGRRYAGRTLDDGDIGPFDTLEEALDEADLTFVSEFTTEITAPVLSADQVVAMLYSEPEVDGHVFRINNEAWEYHTTGGFQRSDHRSAKTAKPAPLAGKPKKQQVSVPAVRSGAADDVVVVHLRLEDDCGSKKKQAALEKLEVELSDAIDEADVGQYDGAMYGKGECVIVMYGPDADALLDAVKPILKASPHAKGGFAIKRYRGSPPKVREVKVKL